MYFVLTFVCVFVAATTLSAQTAPREDEPSDNTVYAMHTESSGISEADFVEIDDDDLPEKVWRALQHVRYKDSIIMSYYKHHSSALYAVKVRFDDQIRFDVFTNRGTRYE